jgi:hypothetical protein
MAVKNGKPIAVKTMRMPTTTTSSTRVYPPCSISPDRRILPPMGDPLVLLSLPVLSGSDAALFQADV